MGAAQKKANPVGRPTKYSPAIAAKANELATLGLTHTQIARNLDIARSTIYEWAEIHPELSDALKRSRDGLVSRMESALVGQAEGEITGNATAGIFMLKNLAPDLYKDRRDHTVEVKEGVVINFLGYDDNDDAIDGEFEEL